MLISPAYAQAGGDPTGGLMSLLPLVLIFVVFYFILIRPQQKKAKEHRAMLADLKRGDRIVTGGGIVATVIRVTPDSDEVIAEIARDVRVKLVKGTIQTVLREPGEEVPKPQAQDNEPRHKGEARGRGAKPEAAEPAESKPTTDGSQGEAAPPKQG
jgi:preprotein translocase subunit YajC